METYVTFIQMKIKINLCKHLFKHWNLIYNFSWLAILPHVHLLPCSYTYTGETWFSKADRSMGLLPCQAYRYVDVHGNYTEQMDSCMVSVNIIDSHKIMVKMVPWSKYVITGWILILVIICTQRYIKLTSAELNTKYYKFKYMLTAI